MTALPLLVFYLSGLYRAVARHLDLKVLWLSGVSLATLIALAYLVSTFLQQEHLSSNGDFFTIRRNANLLTFKILRANHFFFSPLKGYSLPSRFPYLWG